MDEFESPDDGGLTGVEGDGKDDDELHEEPESLRMGLDRFIDGGGFRRSVTPGEDTVSGFFILTLPVELPSNTISGLFLPVSLVELWHLKAQSERKNEREEMCTGYKNR